MNAAELHLALNHLPIVGVVFGLLLLAYGKVRASDPVVRAALWSLALVGALAVGVYFTGEPAEHVVEGLARVSESQIDPHEEAALWGAIGGGVLALVSLFGLYRHRTEPVSRGHTSLTLVVALILAGVLSWIAYLGGRINHPELRSGFTVPAEHEEAAGG